MHRKRLSILIFKLLLLFAIVVSFYLLIIPRYRYTYTASLIDKVNLLESTEGPKIVLIGDSNLPMGIDSKTIEKELGMPVVDMGLHGALGNAFHEEMAKLNVSKGDIYVVSHITYADDDTIGDGTLAWITLEDHFQLWRLIRAKDIYTMITTFPNYSKRAISLWFNHAGNEVNLEDHYSRLAFNQYGDENMERKENIFLNGKAAQETHPEINNTCIKRMNELNSYLEKRGATMIVAAHPLIVNESASDKYIQEINEFQGQLKEELDCEVISDYTDYFYDKQYFFDSEYHLTDTGTEMRTQQLIADLKKYIEAGKEWI